MSKPSSYRSEQEDFEKYFGDGLSESERHEMEHRALEDAFEAEAMEGWDEVTLDTAKADLADLRKRLAPEKRTTNWLKIAAVVALLVVASWVILNNIQQQPETLAQDSNTEKSIQKEAEVIKPQSPEPVNEELTATIPSEESIEEEAPEAIEEIPQREARTDLMASNDSEEPTPGFIDNNRTNAPALQSKSEVTEELIVADLDVSELEIVESEIEPPVQVLAAEGQDQKAVRFRSDEPVYSVTSDDLFTVKSKGDWSFRQIQGSVSDKAGQMVPDARIVLNGTSILAVTDLNGNFEMAVPDSLIAPSLTFSSVGFSQLSYSIPSTDTFDVVLEKETTQANSSTAFFSTRSASKTSDDLDFETYDKDSDFAPATPEGGYKKFEKYLKKNTRVPKEARRNGTKGTVLIAVLVSPTGTLSDFKVVRGLGSGCDEEAIRVVKEGPLWIPAKSGGQSIAVNMEIEVKF